MPKSQSGGSRNARKGKRTEYKVRDVLVDEGWWVIRAGGSLGAADFVALKAGERPVLVQVKSTAAGPFSDFGPAARATLREVAKETGAVPVLAHWPTHGKLRWYDEAVWIS